MAKSPIWVKTPKGVEEIEKRTQRLSVRARRVLILIDGKRDFAALSTLVPGETLPEICRQLLGDGYIAAVRPPGSAIETSENAPISAARTPLSMVEQQRLSMARNFMTNTLTMFVGHAASSLINHVEAAHDLAHLRGLAKQWREALALSADGRKQLADLSSRLVVIDGRFFAALTEAKVIDVRPPPKTPAALPPTPADDGEHLAMARNFMLNTLNTFVGLAASSLVSRIENCPDRSGLRTLFDEWRDAIALSRDGRKRLRELDSQLAALLA